MKIHTLANTPKDIYWEHVLRAETAKAELGYLLEKGTWATKDALQEFILSQSMSDDMVVTLRQATFSPNIQNGINMGLQFNMPSTQDVRDALFDWEEKGCPKLGRKVHITH